MTTLMMNDDSTKTVSAPDHFTCPLTMDVMSFPMLHVPTGKRFERETILGWIYRGNATCPLTRRPMHPSELVLDVKLQEEIQQWKHSQRRTDAAAGESDHSDSSTEEDFDLAFDEILSIANSITETTARLRRSSTTSSSTPPQRRTRSAPTTTTTPSTSSLVSNVMMRREERIAQALANAAGNKKPSTFTTEMSPTRNDRITNIRNRVLAQQQLRLQSLNL